MQALRQFAPTLGGLVIGRLVLGQPGRFDQAAHQRGQALDQLVDVQAARPIGDLARIGLKRHGRVAVDSLA
jgi:hypothetical protein